jgi:DNA replication and repair protein RecF
VKLINLSLYQFKNHELAQFDFNHRITCIFGPNGAGKTNILDAIYALAYCKSYFNSKDAQMVSNGKEGMRIAGKFEIITDDTINIQLLIRENGKKELKHDDENIKQISKHIGKVACIMIAPDDIALINEGSEMRRKYLDATISQTDSVYLEHLVQYNKILAQRNGLMKRWQNSSDDEKSILSFFDQQLNTHSQYIFSKRKIAAQELLESAGKKYLTIGDQDKGIILGYQSRLHTIPMLTLLQQSLQKDIILGRTTEGIHKDDISIAFNDEYAFKDAASQGEKKTMLFALKLAQYDFLKKNLGFTPILLLDDIFEKLDQQRATMLLQMVQMDNAQAIITDTHRVRLEQAFEGKEVGYIELG